MTAATFQLPLLRLDVGRILGKYVGESEENLRQALRLAEAASPCVLWIDEVEKAFAGLSEGGGGVTARLFGHFLTWMQERKQPVFVVATANKIHQLPPEFFRRGRFSERFSIQLPHAGERQQILDVHLRKRERVRCSEVRKDLTSLAQQTEGASGADLEGFVQDAIERAFLERLDQPESTEGLLVLTTEHLRAAIAEWAEGREALPESARAKLREERESRLSALLAKGFSSASLVPMP